MRSPTTAAARSFPSTTAHRGESSPGSASPYVRVIAAPTLDPNPPTRPALGYAQVLLGSILFGLGASVGKVALEAGVEPARLTALRCTGAGIGLLLVLAVVRPALLRVDWRELPVLAALGMFGGALIQWLYFVAIERLPVGIALLLEFTGPLFIAIYSRVVLGQAVRRRTWVALAISLVGLGLVAQVWRGASLDAVGVAAGFGAALCLATFYLLSKHTLQRIHPMTVSFWMFAGASVFWAVAQPWWRFDASVLTERTSMLGALEDVSWPLWVPLVALVVVSTLVAYALAIAALRHLTPTATGIVGMSEPVVAAATAWVWLGQSLGPLQILGGLVVLAGVGLVQAER